MGDTELVIRVRGHVGRNAWMKTELGELGVKNGPRCVSTDSSDANGDRQSLATRRNSLGKQRRDADRVRGWTMNASFESVCWTCA
jgi:hypothetical protein